MTKTAPAPDDGFTTMGPDAQEYDRYALVTIQEDQVILYDIDLDIDPIESLEYGPTPHTTRNFHTVFAVIEGQYDAIDGRPMTINGATLRCVLPGFTCHVTVETRHRTVDGGRVLERTVVWEGIPTTPRPSPLRWMRRRRRS